MSDGQEMTPETIAPAATRTPRTRARRFGVWLEASLCAAALVAAAAVPLAGLGWGADLVANFAAHAAAATIALLVLGLLLRRRRLVVVLAGVLVLQGAQLLRPRAPGGRAAPTLRLLIHNTHSRNPDIRAVEAELIESNADVVVLVDVSPDFVRALPALSAITEAYPHQLRRGPIPDSTGWRIVLSRWPLDDHRTPKDLRCVVRQPGHPFALLALHPASPRDGGRWRRGNGLVVEAATAARAFEDAGLPVIVAGDLNSTPSGWRDRLLTAHSGLRRCKPRGALTGTFPAGLPGPLRLALDDAWVSPAWRVSSWTVGDDAGSDHSSLLVELSLSPSGLD